MNFQEHEAKEGKPTKGEWHGRAYRHGQTVPMFWFGKNRELLLARWEVFECVAWHQTKRDSLNLEQEWVWNGGRLILREKRWECVQEVRKEEKEHKRDQKSHGLGETKYS